MGAPTIGSNGTRRYAPSGFDEWGVVLFVFLPFALLCVLGVLLVTWMLVILPLMLLGVIG